MFYTYGLHPNFVVTKYGRDSFGQSINLIKPKLGFLSQLGHFLGICST
jgi:hypothetical protein